MCRRAGGDLEVGADMSKFPSDKHFASWLGLCPGTKITGGKVMSGLGLALRQPRGPGAATGGSGPAFEPVGAGCILPAHVCAHGQTQSRHGRRPQAGPIDLRHAHPRSGIHRSRAGLLQGALPPARPAQPRPQGQNHGHAARPRRKNPVKSPEKSITYLVFLERHHLRGLNTQKSLLSSHPPHVVYQPVQTLVHLSGILDRVKGSREL